jgi:hypothetical protein
MCWQGVIGLFVIPAFFSLLQLGASLRIIAQVPPYRLTDGILYIQQSWMLQTVGVHWIIRTLRYGLYPTFLAPLDIPGLDWATSGADPHIIIVYVLQAVLLAGATALFLRSAFRFLGGIFWIRAVASTLLGVSLLSALVIVWPPQVLMESITLTVLLLFAAACIIHDARQDWALAMIGLSACLLIWVRDPIIFFVWMFVFLLGLNIVLRRTTRTLAISAGLAALLFAVALGGLRTTLVAPTGKYVQPLVNIIQLRILPDPDYRAFFVAHGLALSPTVVDRSGKVAQQDNLLFMSDAEVPPDFVTYRNWVMTDGFRTYARFLLTHPGYLLRSVFVSPNLGPSAEYAADVFFSMADLFSVPRAAGYWIELTPYSKGLRNVLLAPLGWPVSFLYLVVIIVRYGRQTIRRDHASAIEVAAIVAYVSIFISYHTDGLDLWRHTAPLVLLIYLSFVATAADIANALFRRFHNNILPGSGLTELRKLTFAE